MNRRLYFGVLGIPAFAAIALFTDPFSLVIFGVLPLIWIGLPTALIGGLFLLISSRTAYYRRLWQLILCGIFGWACFVVLLVPANHFVQERAVVVAKGYPAQAGPALEEYRQKHGAYPKSLDQLPSKPPSPRLIRDFNYYSDGQSYSFMFPRPGGVLDTWHYDSRTRTWRLFT